MASVTAVPAEAGFPLIGVPKISRHLLLSSTVFFVCDAAAILFTGTMVWLAGRINDESLDLHRYFALWPALGVFVVIFLATNLYPGVIYNAVNELRRLALALTFSFVLLAGLILATRTAHDYPGRLLFLWWMAAMMVNPLLRSGVRGLICHKSWWGIPVAVFHTGEESADIINELEIHPEIGLRPVAILAVSHPPRLRNRLPVLDLHLAAAVRAWGVDRAMIALPDAGSGKLLQDLEKFESLFP